MTSDLQLLRVHLVSLRTKELQAGHRLALDGNPASFTLISQRAACAELIERLLRDLKELEDHRGEFAMRNIHDE